MKTEKEKLQLIEMFLRELKYKYFSINNINNVNKRNYYNSIFLIFNGINIK